MTTQELQAGIDRNNARAKDPKAWRLRWISAALIPTGTFFSFQFQIPSAAWEYKLEYLIAWWPVTEVFRPLFCDISDDRGQRFVMTGQGPEISRGMPFNLFTTPGTDPNSALAGDQSAYKGMMPLGLRFPGRAIVTLNIRGATAAPDPSQLNILLVGHQKNQAG